MKNRELKEIEKGTIETIRKYLASIDDYVEQFSAFLTWIIGTKYLIELRICWESQGFEEEYSFMKLLTICLQLIKQECNETNKQTQQIREAMWKEALEAAKGNEKKALRLYSSKWKPTFKNLK